MATVSTIMTMTTPLLVTSIEAVRAGAHRTLLADEAAQAQGADHVLECIGLTKTVELAATTKRILDDVDRRNRCVHGILLLIAIPSPVPIPPF